MAPSYPSATFSSTRRQVVVTRAGTMSGRLRSDVAVYQVLRRTGIGASSSLPDAPAKVASQSDLPTFVGLEPPVSSAPGKARSTIDMKAL